MARVGNEGALSQSEISRQSAELAQLGSQSGTFSEEDVKWIFQTVAKDCVDKRDQLVYLRKCNAHGLSPWKNELYAIARYDKQAQRKVVTYVTSYYVFVSRARRAGFIIAGHEVCENDNFEWDAKRSVPSVHTFKASGRGKVVGGYAYAIDTRVAGKPEPVPGCGKYWPSGELLSQGKNPLRDQIPGHFIWKTAVCRIARVVAPDLSSLYSMEEFGMTDQVGGGAQSEIDVTPPSGDKGEAMRESESIADTLRKQQEEGATDAEIVEKVDDEESSVDVDARATLAHRKQIVAALKAEGKTDAQSSLARLSEILGRDVLATNDIRISELPALNEALGVEVS